MDIASLADFGAWGRDGVREIYEAAFPVRQREPFDQFLSRVRDGASACLVGVVDGEPVGLTSWSLLDSGRWAFIEYVAVDAARRGTGLGSALWSAVLDRLRAAAVPRLVLEVEDPAEAADEEERRASERRIRFYRHAGARLLPATDYVVPNLDGSGVERFLLMWQPAADPAPPAPERTPSLLRALLTEGYGLPPDHPLVRAAAAPG